MSSGSEAVQSGAAELARCGIRTMRGGAWTATRVRNVLLRSGA
jgi:hypothetical protein